MCNICIVINQNIKTMGRMKEKLIEQREQECYDNETLKAYYHNILLLSEEEESTKETINLLSEAQDENRK